MAKDKQNQEADDTPEQPLPPWLHPDDDEMPPPELQKIYGKLDQSITRVCEDARRRMRDGFLDGMRTVRDALAQAGEQFFKEWCEAAGFGHQYRAIINALSRADRAPRQPEQPSRYQGDVNSPASGGGARAGGGKQKNPHLVVKLTSDEEMAETKRRLRNVELHARGREEDDWRVALLFLLDYYEEREDTAPSAPPIRVAEFQEHQPDAEAIYAELQAAMADERAAALGEQPAVALLPPGDASSAEGANA